MSDETVTALDKLTLPWAKEVEVQEVTYEGGLRMLRLRFREGRHRFTIVDLDPATAGRLGEMLVRFATASSSGHE